MGILERSLVREPRRVDRLAVSPPPLQLGVTDFVFDSVSVFQVFGGVLEFFSPVVTHPAVPGSSKKIPLVFSRTRLVLLGDAWKWCSYLRPSNVWPLSPSFRQCLTRCPLQIF